ncbi:hypothetical protein HK104_006746, partial [Borealophlyctis nickersoniae]
MQDFADISRRPSRRRGQRSGGELLIDAQQPRDLATAMMGVQEAMTVVPTRTVVRAAPTVDPLRLPANAIAQRRVGGPHSAAGSRLRSGGGGWLPAQGAKLLPRKRHPSASSHHAVAQDTLNYFGVGPGGLRRRTQSDPSPGQKVVNLGGGAFLNIDEKEDDEVDEEAVQRIRERWKMVFTAVKRMVRASNIFRLFNVPILGGDDAALPKPKAGKGDIFASSKIHILLVKCRFSNNPEDLVVLDRFLIKSLPSMMRFSFEQRKQMYRGTLTYEAHLKGTPVMRENYQAESVYFILSGNVEVFKDYRGTRLKQNLIGPGELFGELQAHHLLQEGGRTRGMNVTCVSNCEFLRLDLDEYVRIVFGHDGGDVDVRVVLLNSLPMFQNASEVTLQKAVQASTVRIFRGGERIILESEPVTSVYMITKGQVRCTRMAKFLRTFLLPQSDYGVLQGQALIAPFEDDGTKQPKMGEELFSKELQ